MDIQSEIESCIAELQEETAILKVAENREEEVEALKDIMEVFLRGVNSVRTHIDRYNERRWNR